MAEAAGADKRCRDTAAGAGSQMGVASGEGQSSCSSPSASCCSYRRSGCRLVTSRSRGSPLGPLVVSCEWLGRQLGEGRHLAFGAGGRCGGGSCRKFKCQRMPWRLTSAARSNSGATTAVKNHCTPREPAPQSEDDYIVALTSLSPSRNLRKSSPHTCEPNSPHCEN